ncbi:MAG: AlpA family transcriptional regulator [Alphaproteobacteria bacterium]
MANTNSGSLVPYNGLSSQIAEVDAAKRAVVIITRPVRQSKKLSEIVSPPDPPGELLRILRLPEVINRVGLKRAAIYHHMARGKFPRQIALSDRAVGWVEQEIEAWLTARIQTRPQQET